MHEWAVSPHIFKRIFPSESSATFTKSHNSFAMIYVFTQQSTQSPLAEVGDGRVRDTWGIQVWPIPAKKCNLGITCKRCSNLRIPNMDRCREANGTGTHFQYSFGGPPWVHSVACHQCFLLPAATQKQDQTFWCYLCLWQVATHFCISSTKDHKQKNDLTAALQRACKVVANFWLQREFWGELVLKMHVWSWEWEEELTTKRHKENLGGC